MRLGKGLPFGGARATLSGVRGALMFGVLAVLAGCGDTTPATTTTGSGGTDSSESGMSGDSGSTGAADTTSGTSGGAGECVALFGRPNEQTGLTDEQCNPACPCLDGWVAPTYDEEAIAALEALTLQDPPEPLDDDPYANEPPGLPPELVCGVLVAGEAYSLQTYDDQAAAVADGAIVTHFGPCGRCSPLSDLAVYMRQGDLTGPVRECGVLGLTQGDDANLQCLLDLGFSLPCAQIWLYNTINTRDACLDECLDALDEPYHLPDGSLNPCLACDEQQSGAVFKAVAGRTRRNTGLASAICRPCDQVHQLVHVYE